jgi:hypothetical protein
MARTLKLLDCSPISCFNFDMEILSFGIDCAPGDKKSLRLRGPLSDQSPAAHLTFHYREHFSMIVNSAPRGALNCSPSRGNLFTLPWNPCSRSHGNAVHHRVEYAPSYSSRFIYVPGHHFMCPEFTFS